MAAAVTTSQGGYSPDGLSNAKVQVKGLVDKLNECGDTEGAEWIVKHGLGSANNDPQVIHNIQWRAGFGTVVSTMRSIRDLLPDSFSPPVVRPRDSPFRVAPIEGRGFGLFATRAIPAGVPVLVEPPSLVLSLLFPDGEPSGVSSSCGASTGHDPKKPPKNAYLNAMLEHMDPSQKKVLLALCNCKPLETCSVEEGIIRTNAIGVRLRVPKELAGFPLHRAIFLDLSRANHSCCPNLGYVWDVNSFTITAFTLREIKEGEELTISYIDKHLPWAQRQQRLQAMYLFDCACKACTMAGSARAKSDKRRAEILALSPTLEVPPMMDRYNAQRRWDADELEREMLRPLKACYSLFAKEDLPAGIVQAQCADMLMRLFGDMGEFDKAVLWAKRAAQAWMVRYWYADEKERPLLLEFVACCKAVVDHTPRMHVGK